MMASTVPSAQVFGLPTAVNEIFLGSGVALILTTITIGQLTSQVNAASCMLDFVNNWFMYITTHLSLGIEKSGILHAVYLVQILFSTITGETIKSSEPPRTVFQSTMFWLRVLFSVVILGVAFAVTLAALFDGKTAMWNGVPESVSVILFFTLMSFVGLMEGMQIALFAVVNVPLEELKSHPTAFANCQLTFRDQNLQAFLIGRQICVTICMFVVARITKINVDVGTGEETIFGIGDHFQEFLNTGLLGAVITTIVGSLCWRIIASSSPIAFLSNPLVNLIIRLCLLLEASGVCSSAWILGRLHKVSSGYQPDNVHLEGAERHGKEPITRRDKDIDVTLAVLKFAYSFALLIFSVTVVMAAIFTEQTTIADSVHPLVAFFVLWGLIIWLAMMEGGQGCLVGLQPIDQKLYAGTHPLTLLCTTLVHDGDSMRRFIVGRQFLVVLVVFGINLCGSAISGANVLGFSNFVNEVFLGTGVALMLTTIMLGQLTAQVSSLNCLLDFVNNWGMLFTTYILLAIEKSGLLHCVYLVQILFSRLTGRPFDFGDGSEGPATKFFFWARVTMSMAILCFAFAVTLAALFEGKTAMWDVPKYVSIIMFFALMCVVGLMEGMQIALFAIVNLPEDELKSHTIAYANCRLVFSGSNFQAFLIGRQICVTICMFILARITTISVDIDDGESTIFGVSTPLQDFFNTGLLGAVITTVVASLTWRVVASSCPLVFMSNPLVYLIIRLCLLLEASGVCAAAWMLAAILKRVAAFKPDEEYLRPASEEEDPETKKVPTVEVLWQINEDSD